jgi:hypothetical protein
MSEAEILTFYDSNKSTPSKQEARRELITRLQSVLSSIHTTARFEIFGSVGTSNIYCVFNTGTVSGLDLKHSDLDLGIIFSDQPDVKVTRS